jgi:hypothetical protein
MAQSLETPPTSVLRGPPTAWERDETAWNLPRLTPVATASSVSHRTGDEELDWKSFVATYFPDTGRHNLKPILAYSDYKRSFRLGKQSASEPDADASSIEDWENEGGSPSVVHTRG